MHELKVIFLSWLVVYVFCFRFQVDLDGSESESSIKSAQLHSDGGFTHVRSSHRSKNQRAGGRQVLKSQRMISMNISMNGTSAGHSVLHPAEKIMNQTEIAPADSDKPRSLKHQRMTNVSSSSNLSGYVGLDEDNSPEVFSNSGLISADDYAPRDNVGSKNSGQPSADREDDASDDRQWVSDLATELASLEAHLPEKFDLVVKPTGDFQKDFDSRVEKFEERCARPDIWNPFHELWSEAEINELCSGTLIVSYFFNSKPFFQKLRGWGMQHVQMFKYIRNWYNSIQEHKLCAIVFHDIPGQKGEWYQRNKGTQMIRFKYVDPIMYDKIFSREFGLNDVRYHFVHQAICANLGWEWAFYTDIFDVTVARSPVGEGKQGVLYAGTDNDVISSEWLEATFRDMGGRYLDFWKSNLRYMEKLMWRSGFIGGHRKTFTGFLAKYLACLTDPDIAMNKKDSKTPRGDRAFQNVNMPALNYVCERFYGNQCQGHMPFDSKYGKFEKDRSDFWFIHR